MLRKSFIRSSLLGAAALLVGACFSDKGNTAQYDGYFAVRFEPDSPYDLAAFIDTYFRGGKDTVSVNKYVSVSRVSHCSTVAEDGSLVGGFALCTGAHSRIGADEPASRFAVYDEGGHDGSGVYAVFHDTTATLMPEHAILGFVPNEQSTLSPTSVFVHNVQAVVQAARLGTGLAGGPFADSDYLQLTLTGYKGGVKSGEKSVKLVDGLRPLEEWTEVDLSALGSIDQIDLSLTSSRPDLPLYCCLDNMLYHYIEIY